jgi:Ca2+-binding EF-hand superfamily protein
MAVPLILILAAAAAQTPAPVPAIRGPARGRAFMSPMGEPFFGRQQGEDGLATWFAQADRNRDGLLTIDELADDAQRFFLTLDTNHDGEIDPDEITHYEEFIQPNKTDNEVGAGRLGLLQIPEPVASADTNFNRGVSAEEFRQAARARFQLLDTNRTGGLSLSQLQGTRQAAASASRRRPTETFQPTVQTSPDSPDVPQTQPY